MCDSLQARRPPRLDRQEHSEKLRALMGNVLSVMEESGPGKSAKTSGNYASIAVWLCCWIYRRSRRNRLGNFSEFSHVVKAKQGELLCTIIAKVAHRWQHVRVIRWHALVPLAWFGIVAQSLWCNFRVGGTRHAISNKASPQHDIFTMVSGLQRSLRDGGRCGLALGEPSTRQRTDEGGLASRPEASVHG